MNKHCYPQCAYKNCVFVCVFKAGRMRKFPVTLATPVIHASYAVYDIITNTDAGTPMHRCPLTCNKKPRGCFVCLSVATAESWMGCVTPSQYPRIPAGSLDTSSSSSLLALPGERQVVMLCREGRGGRPEAYCADGEISTTSTATATRIHTM